MYIYIERERERRRCPLLEKLAVLCGLLAYGLALPMLSRAGSTDRPGNTHSATRHREREK